MSRANLLGQNEPGKGRGRKGERKGKDFPVNTEGNCHQRVARGAISGSGIFVLAGYFPVHSVGKW